MLQSFAPFRVAAPGLDVTPLEVDAGTARLDLAFNLSETGGGLAGRIEYSTELFDDATIRRLAGHFESLLRHAAAEPSSRLGDLSLLSAPERQQLVREWSAGPDDYDVQSSRRRLYYELFEARAGRTPDRVALIFEQAFLSYRELGLRARRLARRLAAAGVGPEARVGVMMERSFDMVTALLAVAEAGGAYVPLDPALPRERLTFMMNDAAVAAVVADRGLSGLAGASGASVVCQGAGRPPVAGRQADVPAVRTRPDHPVYVIYTSGSTGRPKGVVVSHGGLSNFLGSMREAPGLTDGDVVAAVTTISFDIAGLELYLPLLVGARVELLSRETASDGLDLAEALQACGATVLQATPATWRLLIESGWQGAPSLRAFCGGEGLPRELADALLARVGQLWNLYGPTETTIWSTAERVAPSPAPVSIGRPIANTQVYVLDAHQQPLPVGVPGELWIGGAGVALGYHQRPELTAERFVADPFSPQAGARLYRTGDLARWDAEGRLQHLGRLDHQVKIRGFRIELGEIETRLATHEAVQQTVVMGREAAPGDLRLVAYIVFAPGADLTASDVRRHLRRDLPDYMIPSVVAAVDAIPLTPNGKVDRAALPDPFKNAVQAARHYVPPEGGAEQTMAEIWRDILKVERVGAEDNFFELGGHSLLSLRVVLAVEQKLGWRMDARTLFFQNLRQVVASAAAGKGVLKA